MQRLGLRSLAAALSVILVFGLAIAGFSAVRAQDDDVTVDGPGTPRPGHIHAGSCEGGGLGDVVFALNDATIDNLDSEYVAGDDDVEFGGSEDANPVYVSETSIPDVTLDDILADDHAINFHLSADEIQTYISCGEIGGFVRDGELYVGLVPVEESTGPQFAGSALLSENEDGGVNVVVRLVQLPETGDTAPASAPAATPITTTPVESAAPSEDESVAPSADESAAPSDDESAAPSADESVAPSADESAAPSVDESAAPSVDESAAPSADESAASDEEASPSAA